MAKLMKYFKKSIIPILFILILLVIQANADLSLPQYMSNIVNVGIQQGGIESIVPSEIRTTEMEKLFYFMTDDQRASIDNSYKIKESATQSGTQVYTLDSDVTQKDISELEKVFAYPIAKVQALESSSDEIMKNMKPMLANMPQGALPENATIFDVLAVMPEQQKATMLETLNTQLEKLDELDISIASQMDIAYVKAEYKALDMNMDKIQSDYILKMGLFMLGWALVTVICTIFVTLLASKIGAKFGRDIRGDVFKKVISFSNKEYNQFSTASLITRCTNDIQQIQMLIIMSLRMIIYAPILGVGALFKVVNMAEGMTWVIGLGVGVVLAVVLVLMFLAMPKFNLLQKLVDKLNLVSREILTGLPVIRAFSREKFEENRFDKANVELTKTNLFVNRVMVFMFPAMMFIMNAICVLIVWVGAGFIDNGSMQVGNLMAFIQYTMQIIMSFLMLSMMSVMLPRALVSAKRVSQVLTTEVTVHEPTNPKEFKKDQKGIVEFKDVYFRYPGAEEDVLRNICFTANPGETTAFIGSTGSGKSTLVNLIPRFFDVTGGKIKIDGVDIRDVKKKELRQKLGYVPQKGILFSGTIQSNIEYGNTEKSLDNAKKAAEIAQSTEFIDAKPEGYDSEISQGGTNVSGGQRQRLSIARAIAKHPEIYIFDDSFSALDFKTDSNLRKALNSATKESTILIVAQRISTVLNADKIIVLDNGEIAGIGTHKELLKNCDVYNQIAASQLSKEELER